MAWVLDQPVVGQYLVVWLPNTVPTSWCFGYLVREPDAHRIKDPPGNLGSAKMANTMTHVQRTKIKLMKTDNILLTSLNQVQHLYQINPNP